MNGVQLCGLHPAVNCTAIAAFDASTLPPRLATLLRVPPPLNSLHEVTARFSSPYVFWTRPGGKFGTPVHFDMVCEYTLSMQHSGRKKWVLWAPWDVPSADGESSVAAHTRFEVVADAGDAVLYPPAWFHATEAEAGDHSVTAAVDVLGFPTYGALGGRSLRSPFGFGACAKRWLAQSREWDAALLTSGAAASNRRDEL